MEVWTRAAFFFCLLFVNHHMRLFLPLLFQGEWKGGEGGGRGEREREREGPKWERHIRCLPPALAPVGGRE